jgi:tetratricopeptide (TPR) repeat protein
MYRKFMRQASGWLVALVSLCVVSCATTGERSRVDGTPSSKQESRIEADPMLVQADPDGGPGRTVESKDVFKKAYQAYSDRKYEAAVQHYETIIKYFDESRFYQPSLYNAGLAYERLQRWERAAEVYRIIIETYPNEADTKDAYFRLAQVYDELGEHRKMADLMTQVMLRKGLSTFDRIEAHLRRGMALLELERPKEAESSFRSLLEINADAVPKKQLASDSRYIVRAHFGLGRAFHQRLTEIPLSLPPESMGQDLEKKANLLMEAQSHYIEALRQHHPHWSVAAGYMVGRLYEDFYSDIYSAEVPTDLSDEQITMYFEELRKRLKPLMERAIDVYEKNLSLSKRIGETPANNKWVRQTSKSLERMRDYLESPMTRKRAQQLARSGKDFRELWDSLDQAEVGIRKAIEAAKKQTDTAVTSMRLDSTAK